MTIHKASNGDVEAKEAGPTSLGKDRFKMVFVEAVTLRDGQSQNQGSRIQSEQREAQAETGTDSDGGIVSRGE